MNNNEEPKMKKINIFRRFKNKIIVTGAKAKKKWATEKVASFTVTKMNETLVKELIQAVGEKEAMEKIFRAAANLGHEYMLELSSLLEGHIDTMPAYAQAAWLMFSGHKLEATNYQEIQIGEYTCPALKFVDPSCPWCKNISFESPFCTYPAGAYNGAGQTWAELTDEPYNFFVRELKCKAQGAKHCEFLFLACPKDMSIDVLKQEKPEWFEYIDYGFFSFD